MSQLLPSRCDNATQRPGSGSAKHFATDHLTGDLKGHSIRSGAITICVQAILFSLNLLQIVVLSRLLPPTDFGLLAMVTAVTGFALTLKDGGLGYATVQKSEINHDQISVLFWVNALIGLGLALLIACSAPMIAWFYHEPRLQPVTLAMAIPFVFSGLSIQHQALLRRQMRFRALAVIQVTSLLAGVLTAIISAWRGAGYWSLVTLPVVQAIVDTLLTWFFSGWVPGLPQRRTGAREMLAFGGNLTAASSLGYLGVNLDKILIGSSLGPMILGLYERSFRLFMLPVSQINVPVSAVAVPALSRIVQEPARYRLAYLETVEKILVFVCPVVTLSIVCSDWIILLTMGEQWGEAATIFSTLAIAALVLPLWNSTGWLFVSQGRMREHLHFHLVDSVFKIFSVLIGIQWGVLGVCTVVAIRYYVMIPFLFWMIGRSGPVRTRDFYSMLRMPSLIVLLTLISLCTFRTGISGELSPIVGLFLCLLICGVTTSASLGALSGGRRLMMSMKQDLQSLFVKQTERVNA